MKRINLKCFRTKQQLTQKEMADKIGVSRAMYIRVENGAMSGTFEFWGRLQKTFSVPDEDMWELTKQE